MRPRKAEGLDERLIKCYKDINRILDETDKMLRKYKLCPGLSDELSDITKERDDGIRVLNELRVTTLKLVGEDSPNTMKLFNELTSLYKKDITPIEFMRDVVAYHDIVTALKESNLDLDDTAIMQMIESIRTTNRVVYIDGLMSLLLYGMCQPCPTPDPMYLKPEDK